MNKPNISRRNFLKLGAGAAGLAIAGCHDKKSNRAITPPFYTCDDSAVFALDENEKMGDVRPTLTKVDLSDLLRDSTIVTPTGANGVRQYLHFGDVPFMPALNQGGLPNHPQSGAVIFGENEYDVTDNYLFFNDSDRIFVHELSFVNGIQSDVDVDGNLIDLVGKEINMLGDVSRIARAKSTGTQLELALMSGLFKSQPAFFGPHTYVIGNQEYEVQVLSSNINGNAQYGVNGEITPMITPGTVYKLADGMMFGHLNAKGTSGPSTVVDFAFNADGLELIDDNTVDDLLSTIPPDRNNESIEDAKVRIYGKTLTSGKFEIQDIRYLLFADALLGDTFIGKGTSLKNHLDEPAGVPGNRLDIVYDGKRADGKHIVRVCDGAKQHGSSKSSGDYGFTQQTF